MDIIKACELVGDLDLQVVVLKDLPCQLFHL